MSELTHLYSGKVRELYDVGGTHLLMVASDRMSAYDVVMEETIPEKGRVLTGLTEYWTAAWAGAAPSALVSCDPAVIENWVPGFLGRTEWHGRAMLARRAQMVNLECIVRARLAGQAYDEYVARGTVHHVAMPEGLRLTDPFDEPLFTPSTKATSGHDENIDWTQAAQIVGEELLERCAALCLDVFARASERLAQVGIVLADSKFELGLIDDELVICDEVVTPDSSRLWFADQVRPGEVPPALDKQPFRDWLTTLDWDKTPPPPPVPADVVEETSRRYVDAYQRITGRSLSDWYGA